MITFPTQAGVEIYPSDTGLICFRQNSFELGKQITVCMTIGQFRKVIKNAQALIDEANINLMERKNG
ncbi:hypothetical protein UFOVP11_58 [uncultured Caudovirales phage]|uniref:Uncharacterized protein n=1 Tax=uncultured Caudovirales phage TaxID=2100421 RepID=A0A6J5KIX7_9CAUD|nr:hypothetical protein UFOVP11_58 [uncultured Caudovirales phage]